MTFKIEDTSKNAFLITSLLLLFLLYVYVQNYDYPNARVVDINEINLIESGTLVKLTAPVTVGNHSIQICLNTCIFLNNYSGKTGVATVIGTLERKKYNTINVLKTYQ